MYNKTIYWTLCQACCTQSLIYFPLNSMEGAPLEFSYKTRRWLTQGQDLNPAQVRFQTQSPSPDITLPFQFLGLVVSVANHSGPQLILQRPDSVCLGLLTEGLKVWMYPCFPSQAHQPLFFHLMNWRHIVCKARRKIQKWVKHSLHSQK